MANTGRPSKYHFDQLLKIEQPAVGHFYGNVNAIRSAASQWARSRNVKIKTQKFLDKENNQEFVQVLVVDYVPTHDDYGRALALPIG